MVEHIHLQLHKIFGLQNVFISTVWSVDFDSSCGLYRGMIHGTYKKISPADSSVLLSSGNVEPVSRFVETYRGADKSLVRPGRKQANFSVTMA